MRQTVNKTRVAVSPRRGEIPSGRTLEECLDEYSPRAQTLRDAQSREVLRVLDLEKALTTTRETVGRATPIPRERRRRRIDARKVYIAVQKSRGHNDVAIMLQMDASGRKELEPPEPWVKVTGLRSWRELWYARKVGFPKLQACVRKYFRIVRPFDPHRSAVQKETRDCDRLRPISKKETA